MPKAKTAKSRKSVAKPKRRIIRAKVKPAPALQLVTPREQFTRSQIELMKRTCARGTTDDEFALFLYTCRKHRLDPFIRQIHCVMRWNESQQQNFMTIQIGIDGYRALAQRNHPDFAGSSEPEFEFEEDGTLLLARTKIWSKSCDVPTVGVAYWKEYCPDLSKKEMWMWRRMPKNQLAKCSEAQGLRKRGFGASGIYVDAEMDQANRDFTPSGRQITEKAVPPPNQEVAKDILIGTLVSIAKKDTGALWMQVRDAENSDHRLLALTPNDVRRLETELPLHVELKVGSVRTDGPGGKHYRMVMGIQEVSPIPQGKITPPLYANRDNERFEEWNRAQGGAD